MPLFIHPQGVPELNKRLAGNGWLANTIANPLGTTIALSHLIFEGTLDRFPRLRICAAHGGGFLPSYAGRFDRGCLTFPGGITVAFSGTPPGNVSIGSNPFRNPSSGSLVKSPNAAVIVIQGNSKVTIAGTP